MGDLKIVYSHDPDTATDLENSAMAEGFEMTHDYLIEEFYNPKDGERLMHVSCDLNNMGRMFYNMLKIQRNISTMALTNPTIHRIIEDVAFRFEAEEKAKEFQKLEADTTTKFQ